MQEANFKPVGEWNLQEIVKGRADLENKLDLIEKLAIQIEGKKSLLQNSISTKEFNSFLKLIEDFFALREELNSYAYLRTSEDTQSDEASALRTKISRMDSEMSNRILFFKEWWLRGIDPKNADRLIEGAGDLSYYLKHMKEMSKHSLSLQEEKIMTLTSESSDALSKIFVRITNGFQYDIKVGGKVRKLNREGLGNIIEGDNSPQERANAYSALFQTYKNNFGVISQIYQEIVLDWKDRNINIRKYDSPISARNMMNDLDDSVVDTLLKTCRKNTPIFKEYYKIKAKALGIDKMRRYDLYSSVKTKKEALNYSYPVAKKIIVDAYQKFNPTLASYAKRVFDDGHIDYGTRKGKMSGAFAMGVSKNIAPYIQVTYNNSFENLNMLAHEIGHTIHYQASYKNHSSLNVEPVIPIAETASTFSELLIFDHVTPTLSNAALKEFLFRRMDGYYKTIPRQAYFTIFEIEAHEMVANGVVSTELTNVYHKLLLEQFEGAVDLSDGFDFEWASVPHIYNTPFYCYSYPFGILLSMALFKRYKEEGPRFGKEYGQILGVGSSQNPQKMLNEHGFDISSSKFWQEGFDYLNEQVNALKKLK